MTHPGFMEAPPLSNSRHLRNAIPATNLETTLIDPLSGSAWDNLIDADPEATAFHTSAWARVLSKTYGHKPFYLRVTENGRLAALLPLMEVASPLTGRRGVSLPFSDYCAPLFFGDCKLEALVDRLAELAAERRWKYVELRGGSRASTIGCGESFYGHVLDLSGGEDAVFARFHPSVRRAIRKAEKSGIAVEILQTSAAMREFFRLHGQTRRRHGLPPQPYSFFRHIHEEMIAPGHGFIALARSASGASVAASIFFHRRNGGLYKFGASEEKYQQFRPNNLTMWEGIRHLVHLGGGTLNFGRTAPRNEGLRRFKLSWGTTEKMLPYWRFNPVRRQIVSAPAAETAGFHQNIFAKLPLALNALAGRLVYPHLD